MKTFKIYVLDCCLPRIVPGTTKRYYRIKFVDVKNESIFHETVIFEDHELFNDITESIKSTLAEAEADLIPEDYTRFHLLLDLKAIGLLSIKTTSNNCPKCGNEIIDGPECMYCIEKHIQIVNQPYYLELKNNGIH